MTNPEIFGTSPAGEPVYRITIENSGTRANLMSWGASLQDFRLAQVPLALVLGSERFEDYLGPMRYFGAIVGPVANRIAHGCAPLGDSILELERNENGVTTLHGGSQGAGQQNWTVAGFDAKSAEFQLEFPDGAGGLPGPVTLSARYEIDDKGALILTLKGTSPVETFCNPAHHSYWNLSGAADITDHKIWIDAKSYLDVDGNKIPTGPPVPVAGTGFDFTNPRLLNAIDKHLLDHNFCLSGSGFRRVCRVTANDLVLELSTDAPGLQVYDGAAIQTGVGLNGADYGRHAGLALEPQYWPDAPNHPDYPSILLKPGIEFRQRSEFWVRPND